MDNRTQLKLITYFFWGLMATIGLLLLTGGFGAATLFQRQKWVDHTNDVLAQAEMCENDFAEAYYAGRSRIIGGVNGEDIPVKREKLSFCIETLKLKTADNAEQVKNLSVIEKEVGQVFGGQDEQFSEVKREGDKIIYDIGTLSKTVQSTQEIEFLFTKVKMHEINLLRLDRMPRVVIWQWRITYAAFAIVLLLLGVASALFSMHKTLLKRILSIGVRFDQLQHDTQSKKGLQKDVEKFNDYLQGVSEQFPDDFFTTVSRA